MKEKQMILYLIKKLIDETEEYEKYEKEYKLWFENYEHYEGDIIKDLMKILEKGGF